MIKGNKNKWLLALVVQPFLTYTEILRIDYFKQENMDFRNDRLYQKPESDIPIY